MSDENDDLVNETPEVKVNKKFMVRGVKGLDSHLLKGFDFRFDPYLYYFINDSTSESDCYNSDCDLSDNLKLKRYNTYIYNVLKRNSYRSWNPINGDYADTNYVNERESCYSKYRGYNEPDSITVHQVPLAPHSRSEIINARNRSNYRSSEVIGTTSDSEDLSSNDESKDHHIKSSNKTCDNIKNKRSEKCYQLGKKPRSSALKQVETKFSHVSDSEDVDDGLNVSVIYRTRLSDSCSTEFECDQNIDINNKSINFKTKCSIDKSSNSCDSSSSLTHQSNLTMKGYKQYKNDSPSMTVNFEEQRSLKKSNKKYRSSLSSNSGEENDEFSYSQQISSSQTANYTDANVSDNRLENNLSRNNARSPSIFGDDTDTGDNERNRQSINGHDHHKKLKTNLNYLSESNSEDEFIGNNTIIKDSTKKPKKSRSSDISCNTFNNRLMSPVLSNAFDCKDTSVTESNGQKSLPVFSSLKDSTVVQTPGFMKSLKSKPTSTPYLPKNKDFMSSSGETDDDDDIIGVKRLDDENCELGEVNSVNAEVNRFKSQVMSAMKSIETKLTEGIKSEQFEEDLLFMEDFSDNDEIWVAQCPKSLKIESLRGTKLNFNGKTELSASTKDGKDGISFEAFSSISNENTGISTDSTVSNMYCLIPSKNERQLKLKTIKAKGTIKIEEQIMVPSPNSVKFILTAQVTLPECVKVRHPLLGADFSKRKKRLDDTIKTSNSYCGSKITENNDVNHKKRKRKSHHQNQSNDEIDNMRDNNGISGNFDDGNRSEHYVRSSHKDKKKSKRRKLDHDDKSYPEINYDCVDTRESYDSSKSKKHRKINKESFDTGNYYEELDIGCDNQVNLEIDHTVKKKKKKKHKRSRQDD